MAIAGAAGVRALINSIDATFNAKIYTENIEQNALKQLPLKCPEKV